MFAVIFLASIIASVYPAEWSYECPTGPSSWPILFPDFCNGTSQSPININFDEVVSTGIPPIEFIGYDKSLNDVVIINNGQTVEILPPPCSYIAITGGGLEGTYRFHNLHFHWGSCKSNGSEHTLNGKAYPLEAHLVHYNEKYGSLEEAVRHPDGLAVLGILYEFQPNSCCRNSLMEEITKNLKRVKFANESATISLGKSLQNILPNDTDCFIRYKGSLTTPTCNEVVTWTVFTSLQKINNKQLKKFRNLKSTARGEEEKPLVNNFRPPQPLNGRTIEISQCSCP